MDSVQAVGRFVQLPGVNKIRHRLSDEDISLPKSDLERWIGELDDVVRRARFDGGERPLLRLNANDAHDERLVGAVVPDNLNLASARRLELRRSWSGLGWLWR